MELPAIEKMKTVRSFFFFFLSGNAPNISFGLSWRCLLDTQVEMATRQLNLEFRGGME